MYGGEVVGQPPLIENVDEFVGWRRRYGMKWGAGRPLRQSLRCTPNLWGGNHRIDDRCCENRNSCFQFIRSGRPSVDRTEDQLQLLAPSYSTVVQVEAHYLIVSVGEFIKGSGERRSLDIKRINQYAVDVKEDRLRGGSRRHAYSPPEIAVTWPVR